MQASSLLVSFYPRYFGYYDRAITVYTHVSDQFSAFSSKAISCSPREAIYVLDGLLENDTLIRPREHYTDTHGFTEHVFALCYLLGFSFMPRLKDLKDQQLWRMDRKTSYGRLDALFAGWPTPLSSLNSGTNASESRHPCTTGRRRRTLCSIGWPRVHPRTGSRRR